MCIWSVDLSSVQYRCAKHHQINQKTNNQYTVTHYDFSIKTYTILIKPR